MPNETHEISHQAPEEIRYRLNFALEEEDFVAFTSHYFRHVPTGKRRRRFLQGITLGAVLLFAFYDLREKDPSLRAPLQIVLYLALIAVFLGGVYLLFAHWITPKMARMSVRSGPRRRLLGPTEVLLSDLYFTARVAEGTGRIAWPFVDYAGMTRDHIFLHLERLNGFILPLRAFSNETEASACFEFIKSRIGNRKGS